MDARRRRASSRLAPLRVGVTAYAIMVSLTTDTDDGRVAYGGQTVVSVVMQPRP